MGAFAQGNLGGFTGTVVDTSKASVPDAKLTLTSYQTNSVHSVVADCGRSLYDPRAATWRLPAGGGEARFQEICPGERLRSYCHHSTLDIELSVGAVNESVTVTSGAVTLQTTSPEVGTVLERRAILDLPIQVGGSGATTAASGRRQPENFIFLTPGVSGIPWSKNINGSPDFSQEVLYDGISGQLAVTPGFLAQTSPPYEAVEEFKVQNSLFPAEYGRGFGVINFTLRSGSNQFHGGLFEFFRNDKLDARPFFNAVRPRVRFNEYGGSFGGPVLIPKLYNGKDKTFFNFNYTGLRNQPATNGTLVSVPTAAFKQGDFSGFRDAAGNVIPIFDPATTGPDGARTPFPGNIIPANRFSSVARNVLPLIPDPDSPNYFNNFLNRTANPIKDETWSLKGDHIFNPAHRISVAIWKTNTSTPSYSPLGPSTPIGFWGFNPVNGVGLRGSYDYMIRPTLLHHFAAGYTAQQPYPAAGHTQRERDLQASWRTVRLARIPCLQRQQHLWKPGARKLQPAAERSFAEPQL